MAGKKKNRGRPTRILVAERAGVDERTVLQVLRGRGSPLAQRAVRAALIALDVDPGMLAAQDGAFGSAVSRRSLAPQVSRLA
jgi:transcriptional regulator with XRE-family HTH domain